LAAPADNGAGHVFWINERDLDFIAELVEEPRRQCQTREPRPRTRTRTAALYPAI
jgi:hypothetical protein